MFINYTIDQVLNRLIRKPAVVSKIAFNKSIETYKRRNLVGEEYIFYYYTRSIIRVYARDIQYFLFIIDFIFLDITAHQL